MSSGLAQGIEIANALFNPLQQALGDKRALKRRMQELELQSDLQRQLKEQESQDIAKNLLPILNQGRGEQSIPEFQTKFGMKSAAFRDNQGNARDPNKLQNGLSKIPITNLRGETTEYDAEGIRQALAKMNNVPMESPETKQMYSNLLNAQKQLETSDLSGLQTYKPKEGLPLYTQEQLAGLQRVGLLDELVKNQQTMRDLLEGAKYLPEDQRGIYIAQGMAGSKNPYAAINMAQLNPYKIQNYESMINNRDVDNSRADKDLELNQEYKTKVLQLKQQGLNQQQAHQLALEDIARERLGQGAERIKQAYMPTTSTTTDAEGNTRTIVRQKGTQAQPTKQSKRPPLPVFNATFK